MLLIKIPLRLLQMLYSVYAFLLFCVVIISLAPFVMLCFPFGRITGANFMYALFRIFGRLWLVLTGIHHTTSYQAKPDPAKQYIFVANHIAYIDAIIVNCSIRHHFRPIGKYELLRIPIFGFIYKFCVITVNRSSPEDRARSMDDLRKILRRGISVLVFPEGTFNMEHAPMKEMYDGAFKLSLETGTPIQPVLFLDAYDRMPYEHALRLSPGRSRAVYLEPVDPASFPGIDVKMLKEKVFQQMSEQLIAYKASWIDARFFKNHNA